MMLMPRVRAGLLRHDLDGQVVVYDSQCDRVHLLDLTTACVLELLESRTSGMGIEGELARRFDVQATDELLALSIQALGDANLLEQSSQDLKREPLSEPSRRELLRKVAAAGVIGFLVPAITTLVPSMAYAQASCTALGGSGCPTRPCCANSGTCTGGHCCHNLGGSCAAGSAFDCCPGQGTCVSGKCTALGGSGDPCTVSTQCATGFCCASNNALGHKNTCVVTGSEAC